MQHGVVERVAGVESGLLCAWWGPSGAMIGNNDVAAICAAHPDRFTGVASVDLTRPMAAVAELCRCVETYGFRALRVLPWFPTCASSAVTSGFPGWTR